MVKMSFHEKYINDFLINFEAHKTQIRNFKGCRFLELYRDKKNRNIFFTYSYWDSEKALDIYRESELFKNIWSKTKTMFNTKPEAWSLDKIETLD